MKKNLAFAACLTSLLIACDSATIDSGNGAGNSDNETDSNLLPDSTGTGTGTGTGLDGVTTARTANGLVNSVSLIKLEPIGVTVDSTRGLFGDLQTTLTEQEVRDWYIPPTDECEVTPLTGDTMTPDGFLVLDQIATQISAGESIVLTDDNGTYATLQRMDTATGPVYQPEVAIDQPAGTNLLVDIPGDAFSGFPGIAVPPVPELQVDRPAAGDNVGVATFFQWQPNDVPGSTIELYVGGFSQVAGEGIFIACALIDDGSFAFPEEIQAQMGAAFDDEFTTLLRVGYNVAADGDSMVFVANSVRTRVN